MKRRLSVKEVVIAGVLLALILGSTGFGALLMRRHKGPPDSGQSQLSGMRQYQDAATGITMSIPDEWPDPQVTARQAVGTDGSLCDAQRLFVFADGVAIGFNTRDCEIGGGGGVDLIRMTDFEMSGETIQATSPSGAHIVLREVETPEDGMIVAIGASQPDGTTASTETARAIAIRRLPATTTSWASITAVGPLERRDDIASVVRTVSPPR